MVELTYLHAILTPELARAARNYFGLSQMAAAKESGLPDHKIKRFEAGNYIPDEPFLRAYRAFFEGKGYTFPDTPEPGAKAKGKGTVFPAGVIGSPADGQGEPPRNRPAVAQVHHMRVALRDEEEMGRLLDVIEANEEAAEALLRQPIEKTAFFGGVTEESQARHVEALKRLAENGALFARLFGREVGGTAREEVLTGEADPKSHADLLHRSQADAHLTVAGYRDAKARHQARKPAKTVSATLFG